MARFCDEHRTQADAQPENAGTVWVRVDAESRQDRALCSRRRFHSDRCTRPAVAIANSIGACEEHMAKYEEIAGEVGGEPVSWKRIDGQVVALVLLVLAFFYLPGCGPAIASVQANQDRANIAASSARAAWHEDGWFAVGGGYARNSAAGCVFVSMDDKDGHWTSLFVPRDGAK